MKHLSSFAVFENSDEIAPIARDLFGLTHSFYIYFKWLQLGLRITGPLENKQEAESIEQHIRKTLEDYWYNMDFDPDRGIKESEVEAILDPYEEQLSKMGYSVKYEWG